MKIVLYNGDWADEMDVNGFSITSDMCWEEYQKFVNEKGIFPHTKCVGTNEDIEYETAKDYFRDLTAKDITKEEVLVIKKLFGNTHFGQDGMIETFYDKEADDEIYLQYDESLDLETDEKGDLILQ